MNNSQLLWKYAGLTTQLLIGIGIFVYTGMKVDDYFQWKTPVAVWVFPLLFIVVIIIKIITDTSKKKSND